MNKPELEMVGNGKIPVITIDDYATDLSPLIEFAVSHREFSRDKKSYYPGQRSPLPTDYVDKCLSPVIPHLYSIYGIPQHLQAKIVDSRFSLVTQLPGDLQAIQTLPHFDTPSPYTIAVLHYLNDQPHGGTGLFRHKETGFEFISESRQGKYFEYVKKYISEFDSQHAAYCSKEDPRYECYHDFEFKTNRLVIYPGCLLHTALINPGTDIDDSPRTGRLTANMLIEFV